LHREQHITCYESHSCSVVLTYATPASGCGAQGSFQQRRERLARATTRRPLDTTSFVHTPGIPIPNKTVGLSTVAAATCHKPSSQPSVVIRGFLRITPYSCSYKYHNVTIQMQYASLQRNTGNSRQLVANLFSFC
jgi:hypothetical protein